MDDENLPEIVVRNKPPPTFGGGDFWGMLEQIKNEQRANDVLGSLSRTPRS